MPAFIFSARVQILLQDNSRPIWLISRKVFTRPVGWNFARKKSASASLLVALIVAARPNSHVVQNVSVKVRSARRVTQTPPKRRYSCSQAIFFLFFLSFFFLFLFLQLIQKKGEFSILLLPATEMIEFAKHGISSENPLYFSLFSKSYICEANKPDLYCIRHE